MWKYVFTGNTIAGKTTGIAMQDAYMFPEEFDYLLFADCPRLIHWKA